MNLTNRLAALSHARDLGEGLLTAQQTQSADDLLERARTRRSLSPDHTTVGLFGATGSGKSSVFNALVGQEVARTGVLRPTTSSVSAAVWQPSGSEALLEWLGVHEAWMGMNGAPLVLLDLPDFDSVSQANRQVADRLAGQVDVLVWVVDPQKYADRLIHRDYLQPLAHQGSVTLVVLNQSDRLAPEELVRVSGSLRGLLEQDGLGAAPMFAVSAVSGSGIPDLREAVEEIASRKMAADQRLSADIAKWSQAVDGSADAGKKPDSHELLRQVRAASRIDTVADAVGAAYRRRSGQQTGWVLTSWLSRFRPDPLRRLRVEESDSSHTSMPGPSARERALLSTAVRQYTVSAASALPESWRGPTLAAGQTAINQLPDVVDQAVGSVDYRVRRSWWWTLAKILQWLALVIAAFGLGWYLASWATAAFALPEVPITKVEGWPVPGIMLVFGLLLGVLLGGLFAMIGRLVAARRRRQARKRLAGAVDDAVTRVVIEPVQAEVARGEELRRVVQEVGRSR